MKATHLSREQALYWSPEENTCLISITTPGQENIAFTKEREYRCIFRICFIDTVSSFVEDGPTLDVATELYNFLTFCKTTFKNVVVHCEFGASRSAAVGLLAEQLGYDFISKKRATGANPLLVEFFNLLLLADGANVISIPTMEETWGEPA